jgi:ribosomal protein S12 methylthiotransferase
MTFTLESLGCAKNQVDSEELIAYLERSGLAWVPEPADADVIIVNTCGFITSAKEESIQVSLELKARHPEKKVLVAGCLVQRYGRELQEALTEIDGFGGVRDFRGLLERIRGLRSESAPAPTVPGAAGAMPTTAAGPGALPPAPERVPAPTEPIVRRRRFLSYPGSAYVKVAEGCSNHCSYCAIPSIRGELVSRPASDVLVELRSLLDQGVFEIVLIAQDLASFGLDRGQPELVPLLQEVSRLPGRFWLRLLYLHPDRVPEGLLDCVAGDPRILPYFDLPFQHAAPGVLARMGRRGSGSRYLDLIDGIRRRLPQAVLRSTFLVGFPGESAEDFRQLLAFQQSAALEWTGVFTYSREEGTEAWGLGPRVSAAVAERRKHQLEEAQQSITARFLERQVGRNLEVLVEEAVQGEPLYLGRAFLHAPEVDGLVVIQARKLQPGSVVPVRVVRRRGVDLEGVPA